MTKKKQSADDFHKHFAAIANQHDISNNEHVYFHTDNASRAKAILQNIIDRTDSDIRHTLIESSDQRDDMLFSLYCMGFLPSIKKGESLDPPSVQALAFMYSAYWHLGDNFLFGNCVENTLRYFTNPDAGKLKRSYDSELDEKSTLLGFEIWEAMDEVFHMYHRPKQIGPEMSAREPVMPAFRNDFCIRALHLIYQSLGKWKHSHDFLIDNFIKSLEDKDERIAAAKKLMSEPQLATGRCIVHGATQLLDAANNAMPEKKFTAAKGAFFPAVTKLPNYDDFRELNEHLINTTAPFFRSKKGSDPGSTKDDVFEKRIKSLAKAML